MNTVHYNYGCYCLFEKCIILTLAVVEVRNFQQRLLFYTGAVKCSSGNTHFRHLPMLKGKVLVEMGPLDCDCVLFPGSCLWNDQVTICLIKLEMSGNLIVVREISWH